MKRRILSVVLAIFVCISLSLTLTACGEESTEPTTAQATKDEVVEASLWDDATYKEDVTVGQGEKSIAVKVTAEEKSIVITVNTDEKYLEGALLNENIIAGDESEYGLYIKTVNGILADYDADQTYWAIYKDSEYMMEGAGVTEINTGDEYEFVYTK